MQPTEHTPEELYERYGSFFDGLTADLREIARHLPEEKAKGLLPERAGLAEFQRVWRRIASDPASRDRWLKRLGAGEDPAEAAAVRAILHRALTQTTACGEDPQPDMPEAA